MQAFEDETTRVLKKQRLCAAQIDAQLDFLLEEAAITRRQLVDKQREFARKKSSSTTGSNDSNDGDDTAALAVATTTTEAVISSGVASVAAITTAASTTAGSNEPLTTPHSSSSSVATVKSRVFAEEEDSEVDNIVQGFSHRVQLLNVEKNVADELHAIHVALSKYAKLIDKTFCNDITKVCRAQQFDHLLVCRLVAEYLYHDGQIDAADTICEEAKLDVPANYRECFVELHTILDALKTNDLAPALAWARKHRQTLQARNIEIEFALVRLQYVDLLATCADAVDALAFATEQFATFHATHAKEIHRLMGCLVFKDRLHESPYKDLFAATRWSDMRTALIRACCRLHNVPFQSYLDTCLSAGISALPAMRKLATVMESKLTNWSTLEELPVEIPIANDLRFHTVFCCPVSKEESAPGNPPVLLKCGHAICRACVKRISFNMTRRFKCPTCPAEMTESETRELFF